jgi:hypothetical protein
VTLCRCIHTYGLGSPFAVLDSEEVVCEAQIVCKLLKKVNAEAGTAMIEADVSMHCWNVHSVMYIYNTLLVSIHCWI